MNKTTIATLAIIIVICLVLLGLTEGTFTVTGILSWILLPFTLIGLQPESVIFWMSIFYIVILGFFLGLFILPLIPTMIERLSNKPNRFRLDPEKNVELNDTGEYEASNEGYFTKLNPGQVKIVEQGGRFIKAIMRFDDHAFLGELQDSPDREEQFRKILGEDKFNELRKDGKKLLSPSNTEYWEVVETEKNEPDSHPIPFPQLFTLTALLLFPIWPIRLMWWVWKQWVYLVTGYVFTGIYPFRQLRTYPIERFKKIKDKNGVEELVRIEDYSDHYRVADFQYPVTVPEADTQDKIPVQVKIDLVARVVNPYLTAYGTDDWASRLSGTVGDAVTHFTRPRPIQEVLSADTVGNVRALSDEIMKIGTATFREDAPQNSITLFGLKTVSALVYDISPTDEKDAFALGGLARARVQRDSEKALAEGRAANIREQAKAAEEHGAIALAIIKAEQVVRTAAALPPGSTVILGDGGNVNPIDAAMLGELKRVNKSPGTTIEHEPKETNGGT